jgi:hypothetical protein
MKFIEIKVKELNSFVDSVEFGQMKFLPITTLRARSQSINPAADANDVALIYALNEENLLVGYIGLLPANIYSEKVSKIYFLSCWWTHPVAGRGVAMKLFFKMLELTNRKAFFFHMPEKMTAILKALGDYSFPEPYEGFKGFLRLDIQDWLLRGKPGLSFLKPLLFASDTILNIPVSLRLQLKKSQLVKQIKYRTELISEPDEEVLNFVSKITSGKTVFRNIKEIEWIIRNPWISNDSTRYKTEADRYNFSLLAKRWEQHWIKICYEKEVKGIAYLTIRNGVASIPYLWFESGGSGEISKCIAILLIEMKVKAFQTYNQQLISGFSEIENLFIHKRPTRRHIGWSNEMDPLMHNGFMLQDGDGDAVFT